MLPTILYDRVSGSPVVSGSSKGRILRRVENAAHQPIERQIARWTAAVVAVIVLASAVACTSQAGEPAPSIESLLPLIDRAIAKVRSRPLRSDRDTPWVVMHAVIAFGSEIEVLDVGAGEMVNAVEYLTTRAKYDDKWIFRDDDGEPALPTRNLSYGITKSFFVQDHVDQFLMAFAEAGVGLRRRILAEGGAKFTVGDMLSASKRNFQPRQELAWTLVVMSTYLKPGEEWKTKRGERYGITDLLNQAIRRDPVREIEGGSHHLYGVAFALRGRVEELPNEVRTSAEEYLGTYIERTKERQQEDGSFSSAGFRREQKPGNPRELVSTTGHALEWMSIAIPASELRQEWVRRAVDRLCAALESHPTDVFSNGGLYHAAHGLQLYRDAVRPSR